MYFRVNVTCSGGAWLRNSADVGKWLKIVRAEAMFARSMNSSTSLGEKKITNWIYEMYMYFSKILLCTRLWEENFPSYLFESCRTYSKRSVGRPFSSSLKFCDDNARENWWKRKESVSKHPPTHTHIHTHTHTHTHTYIHTPTSLDLSKRSAPLSKRCLRSSKANLCRLQEQKKKNQKMIKESAKCKRKITGMHD